MLRTDANITISTISTADGRQRRDPGQIAAHAPLGVDGDRGDAGLLQRQRARPPAGSPRRRRRRISASSGALRGAVERRVARADEEDRVPAVGRHELVAVHLQRAGARAFEPAQDRREPLQRIGRRQPREHRRHRRRHLLLQRAGGAVQRGVGRRGGHLRLRVVGDEVGQARRVQLVDRLGERRRRARARATPPPDAPPARVASAAAAVLHRLRVGAADVEDQRPRQRRIGELARQVRQPVIGAGGQEVRDVVVDAQAQRAEHDHPDRQRRPRSPSRSRVRSLPAVICCGSGEELRLLGGRCSGGSGRRR